MAAYEEKSKKLETKIEIKHELLAEDPGPSIVESSEHVFDSRQNVRNSILDWHNGFDQEVQRPLSQQVSDPHSNTIPGPNSGQTPGDEEIPENLISPFKQYPNRQR